MQTPPRETVGRRTRSALSEIPVSAHLSTLPATEVLREGRRSFNNNYQNTAMNVPNQTMLTPGTSTILLTPSPSPEELVIQQRGRRRIPATFSPDIEEIKREFLSKDKKDRTPVKQPPGSPGRSNIVLRSTPRKRLLLLDPSESPEKLKMSPSPKKLKIDDELNAYQAEVLGSLKALSCDQLISVIGRLMQKRSGLEEDVKNLMPIPDLRPLEESLLFLKRNISKALPRSRLVSKTDASAYHRASTHVLAFKKSVLEYGQRLVDSKQWPSVIDYIIMSWKIVRSTPVWDNQSHNVPRKQCFKTLAAYCLIAMKNMEFTVEQSKYYQTILNGFLADSDEIQSCLKQADKIYKK